MARPRKKLSQAAEDRMRVLMAKGGTVTEVAETLSREGLCTAASATIGRRMAEMRAEVHAARVARRGASAEASPPPAPVAAVESEPDLPRTPDEIPEGTGLETYDRWLARAERMANDAELDGDLKAIGNAGRLVGFLLEAKRKATPKPVEDPNEHPDMVRMGAEVEARFLKMVDLVLEEM